MGYPSSWTLPYIKDGEEKTNERGNTPVPWDEPISLDMITRKEKKKRKNDISYPNI
jgi:hypothetical protein